MAQDKDVLLSYCREKPDTEITLNKIITYGVMFPSKRRQDFKDMIDRIDWTDSDSYIIYPENKRQERTNMIKTHLKRILGMSNELNMMIECYV
jgi:DTW domain-containing protein YfiP